MSLEFDATQELGAFRLDARFRAEGGLTALFGPSGSGKTSIVNLIAGLARPQRGRIVADGRVLVDTERRIFVPAHRRRIGYVFQEDRLFPHLTVRQNLLYGRWFVAARDRRASFERVVDLLGIEGLLQRRPALLSGGEKQRVAIGRALLASPRLLLMDEPLASLDEARKAEILPYIERLRDEARIPTVYVSHSIDEVARLATTLALVSDGRVDAVGPTQEILGRLDLFPATDRYEAGALLDARVERSDAGHGLTLLRLRGGVLLAPRLELPEGAPIRVRVRARDVIVSLAPQEGISALNVLAATVVELGPARGPVRDVKLDVAGQTLLARLTRRSIETLRLSPGQEVYAIIKSIALDGRSAALAPAGGAGEEWHAL